MTKYYFKPRYEQQQSSSLNSSETDENDDNSCQGWPHCRTSLILPKIESGLNEDIPHTIAFAILFGVSLFYLLFGVSIVTERIVTAAEVILSQKRKVTVRMKGGETRTVHRRIWHPVIGSLLFSIPATSSQTLFLPIMVVIQGNFEADVLGPFLVVGSGAFQLLVTTSVCLLSIKDQNPRPIKHLGPFFISAIFGILAYIWLFVIVGINTPSEISIWEALSIMAIYPAFIIISWISANDYISQCFRFLKRRFSSSIEPFHDDTTSEVSMFDDETPEQATRRKIAAIMQNLRLKYPDKSLDELEAMAEAELVAEAPRSDAFYMLHAFSPVQELTDRVKVSLFLSLLFLIKFN